MIPEIQKALDYLSKTRSDIIKVSENLFEFSYVQPLHYHQNYYVYTADFSKQTLTVYAYDKRSLTVYAYDKRYNNGDHYNCITREVPWADIYTDLMQMLRKQVRLDIEKERIDKAVEDRMKLILADVY